MFLLQALMIVLAICGAVASLRLREPHPRNWDVHQGFRPPVTDDPIFWREYILPWRGSRQPVVVILTRQILMQLRATALMLLQLALLLIAIAVPVGLAFAVAYFGFLAFRELWEQGSYASGTFKARDMFNYVIRAGTAAFALFPLMAIPGTVSAQFTLERDKKTWDALLATVLSGGDIITSKARVSASTTWQAARWLIPVWALGIACGALHPFGVLFVSVELPLAAWAGLALGTWLGLRPGSTTQASNSAAAIWSIGMMILGAAVVVAPLCSMREFGVIRGWPVIARTLIVFFTLALPPLTWAFARSLTRKCYTNFELWIGRPQRTAVEEMK
jgi:hypothetical protein